MESPMSSAISVSSVTSAAPITGPLDNPVRAASEQDLSQETSHSIITPGYRGKLFFDPGDGDLTLSICGTYFETHKYLIKKFSGLRSILCRLSPNATLNLKCDTCTAKDMENTLKVLYATVLEGPFEFDHPTLVSALRVATLYGYPDLSTYAIKRLEQARLGAIDRIKIAREFGLIGWEEPAYIELCERDEPINADEARVLGVDTFVKIAGIRESEQRRRVNVSNMQNKQQEVELEKLKKTGGEIDGEGTKRAKSNKQDSSPLKPGESKHDDKRVESVVLNQPKGSTGSAPMAEMQPSFVGVQTSGSFTSAELKSHSKAHLAVPGCSCKFDGSHGRTCTLPPCAVAAFKNLQIQQTAQTDSIAQLQSFVDEHCEPPVEPLLVTFAHSLDEPSALKPVIPIHEEVRRMLNTLRGGCSPVDAPQGQGVLGS